MKSLLGNPHGWADGACSCKLLRTATGRGSCCARSLQYEVEFIACAAMVAALPTNHAPYSTYVLLLWTRGLWVS